MISEIVDYVELRCMYNIGSYRLLPLTIVEENNFNKQLRGTRFNSLFENVRMSAPSHSGYKIIIAIKFVQPLTVCGHGIYLKKIPL